MYTHTHTRAHTHTHTHIYTHIHIYIYTHTHTYIHIHTAHATTHTHTQVQQDMRAVVRAMFSTLDENYKWTTVQEFLKFNFRDILSAIGDDAQAVARAVYLVTCKGGRSRSPSVCLGIAAACRAAAVIKMTLEEGDDEFGSLLTYTCSLRSASPLASPLLDTMRLSAHYALKRAGAGFVTGQRGPFFADRNNK